MSHVSHPSPMYAVHPSAAASSSRQLAPTSGHPPTGFMSSAPGSSSRNQDPFRDSVKEFFGRPNSSGHHASPSIQAGSSSPSPSVSPQQHASPRPSTSGGSPHGADYSRSPQTRQISSMQSSFAVTANGTSQARPGSSQARLPPSSSSSSSGAPDKGFGVLLPSTSPDLDHDSEDMTFVPLGKKGTGGPERGPTRRRKR
ncbi:hypothetical protein FRC03_003792 [Tulasnella sp. 419]|nr:hypothetical protein FRC02_010071 [Tulasnella sp. 418]KAG8962803.1 hypothetical protein FRC03_003792 [Tulasnella sp. 419]